MSVVDDEFFDEASEGREPAPRSRSGKGSRGGGGRPPRRSSGGSGGSPLQQKGVRTAIIAGVVVVAVLIIITSIRGCQRDRLVDSYKSYLAGSNAIADESATIGNELRGLLENKTFKTPQAIGAAVGELAARAEALVARAEKLDPPDALAGPHRTLITALEYRRDGLRELPEAIDAAVTGKDASVRVTTLAAPLQALGASDVIYQRSFVGPAEAALQKDRIKDVQVKASDYFPGLTYDIASPQGAQKVLSALMQVKAPSGDTTGDSSGGKHGLGLVQVVAVRGAQRTQLVQGGAPVTLPADNSVKFEVTVENGGDFIESNVTVSMTYITPINAKGTTETQTIAQIEPGESKQQKVTFNAPATPWVRDPSEIRVRVEPVEGETVTTNNEYTYPVKFEISG